MAKIMARISVTVSFLILGLYAFEGAALGHPEPLYLAIAPTLGVVCGLNYLRSKRGQEMANLPRNGSGNGK
jgi:hypothetical protein